MAKINFTKMHGCGNDYVYVNAFQEKVVNPVDFSIKVSHRRFGVGSDGLIMICPTPQADVEMKMYNADGSMSEMCGNGIRCVAKYSVDHNIVKNKPASIKVLTGAGIKEIKLVYNASKIVDACVVNMGVPELAGLKIPVKIDKPEVVLQKIKILDREFEMTCASMGNPHCVVYVDDVKNFEVEKYGKVLENHELFPKRTNVEFVQIISKSEVIQRTWERGSGETWACGTGASAVCVAGILTGKTGNKILNHLTGGDLTLEWEGRGKPLFMTGPATEIFSGVAEE